MNQDAMLEILSRSLDEPISPAERACLDQALAESEQLRELAEDFALLKQVAATPVAQAPEISPALLDRLQRPRQQRARWPYGLGLLAAAVALFLLLPKTPAVQEPKLESTWEQANLRVAQAQHRYHRDLAKMEALASLKLVELPPRQARSFAKQWANLDKLMRYCERKTAEVTLPENVQGLAEVYQAKVQLFDAILAS